MTTGGLADVDTGPRDICGGFAREFFYRAGAHYSGTRSFPRKGQECKVSLAVFKEMLSEVSGNVRVFSNVSGLTVDVVRNETISSISVIAPNGTTLHFGRSSDKGPGRVIFIDASYEGDLLRRSASWTVGREANTT